MNRRVDFYTFSEFKDSDWYCFWINEHSPDVTSAAIDCTHIDGHHFTFLYVSVVHFENDTAKFFSLAEKDGNLSANSAKELLVILSEFRVTVERHMAAPKVKG